MMPGMELLEIRTCSLRNHVLLTKVFSPYNSHKLTKPANLICFLRICLVTFNNLQVQLMKEPIFPHHHSIFSRSNHCSHQLKDIGNPLGGLTCPESPPSLQTPEICSCHNAGLGYSFLFS